MLCFGRKARVLGFRNNDSGVNLCGAISDGRQVLDARSTRLHLLLCRQLGSHVLHLND